MFHIGGGRLQELEKIYREHKVLGRRRDFFAFFKAFIGKNAGRNLGVREDKQA